MSRVNHFYQIFYIHSTNRSKTHKILYTYWIEDEDEEINYNSCFIILILLKNLFKIVVFHY